MSGSPSERAPDKVEMTMYDADEFYFRSQDAPGSRPGRTRTAPAAGGTMREKS